MLDVKGETILEEIVWSFFKGYPSQGVKEALVSFL